jgi:acetylornithine/N-succinyldiaminopimelate aminotransferase
MLSQRQLFLNHQAQTSPAPIGLEIVKAEKLYLFDKDGKKYMDLISGIAVSNLGHRHPKVVAAIKNQVDQYMHLMVYGEYIQSPQVLLAKQLAANLPATLDCCYFVNSGSEAVEGALKLAKRYTGRTEIIAFQNAYHGSTQGALSVMGNETFKNAFRPLLPQIRFLEYNNIEDLNKISASTACVIFETIQGEAGAIVPDIDFVRSLAMHCKAAGALLIADEIQTGFGRTGSLFGFNLFGIVPDILTIGKGMGGGMPIGAFIASKEIMSVLMHQPVLGHISTFGGHPVNCAAAGAALEALLEEGHMATVAEKENLFREILVHPQIKEIRGKGLLLAVVFENRDFNFNVIERCIQKGIITDWFLFCDVAMRLAPPLIISETEIREGCAVILSCIEEASNALKQ